MQEIQNLLEQSLEDYSVSRSERKEIKAALVSISTQPIEQAKTRRLAFNGMARKYHQAHLCRRKQNQI